MAYYFTAYHRGGLCECLMTENKITELTFNKLVSSGLYSFYVYDKRIHAENIC